MRILMLSQFYPPIVGGEERVVQNLSRELVSRGHDVAVATLQLPHGDRPSVTDHGVRIYELRSTAHRVAWAYSESDRGHAPPVPDPETVHDLRRVVRRERPQVVHAHNWLVYSFLPLARRAGPAVVLTLHDYSLICATKRLMFFGSELCSGPAPIKCVRCAGEQYGKAKGLAIASANLALRPWLRAAVDAYAPVSTSVARGCQLGDRDIVRVIPNFVDATDKQFAPELEARLDELLPPEPFILFVGDVTIDKGAWHLVEAHRALRDPPPLVLIGRPYLPQLAERPGVKMLGLLSHDLVMAARRRCLFAVVPSVCPEAYALSALEPAAMGIATVATKIGGLPDIVIDGETGILVPPGDVGALSAALERLLGDPELRAKLGFAAARRVSKELSPDAVVPQVEELYAFACARRRERAGDYRGRRRHARTV